jgi:hypothetical protein
MTHQFTDLQEKWLTALESGEYQQCHSELHSNGKFCCLGVGCVILGYEIDGNGFKRPDGSRAAGWLDGVDSVQLGLRCGSGLLRIPFNGNDSLYQMNDDGMTFAEIAAYIRANPENVFVKQEEAA